MKPTFVRVGKPKTITRAPSTVRPPTQADATTRGEDCGESVEINQTSHTITFPSNANTGDLVLAFVNMKAGPITVGPSGWDEEYSVNANGGDDYAYLYTKTLTTADVSAGSVEFTTGSSTNSTSLTHFFRGVTRTDLTISGPVGMDAAEHDPPAVTPTQGAGDYFVVVAFHTNKGGFPTDQATDGPTGYTSWCAANEGGAVLEPEVFTWYAVKSITTSENPSEISWSDSTGSRQYATATISVPQSSGNPEVVGWPVQASDIDSESSTGGQVLTSDGAGGAAWEDVSGVTDHGALTGLADDDHTQYLNVARHDADDHSSLSIGADALTSTYELLVASTDSTIDRFVATADKTIANTTTETTLFGTGEGNLTFPAGFFTAGKAIRVLMRGRLSDTGTPNFTIKMKLGSTVIDSVGPVALTGISDVEWMLDGLITCRSTGASGTFVGGGLFDYDDGTELSLGSGSDISIDTTASQTLDITWQWGTASASNTITVRESAVTLIDPNRDGVGGLEPVFTEAGDDYVYGLVP